MHNIPVSHTHELFLKGREEAESTFRTEVLSGPHSRGRGGAGGKTMTFSLKEEVT